MSEKTCHKCENKCGKSKAHPDVIQALEEKYYKFIKGDSKSLLRKYLTLDVLNVLKCKKTCHLMTLMDCIQSGLEIIDSRVGIYAGCPQCYDLFADLFDPIIQDYHDGFKKSQVQPPVDFGDVTSVRDLDPKKQMVISTRIRCGRSIPGYPFNPGLTEEQYMELENLIANALTQLTDEFQGSYIALNDMTTDEVEKLVREHYLFKDGDKYLNAAKALRYWPMGRGIFFNAEKTFLVWVNEEDHLRIISMAEGGNLKEAYGRFVKGVTEIEKRLEFLRHERLGFLTSCPTNLGTSIRASVHIRIPKLAADNGELKTIAEDLKLQIRGTDDEHTESTSGIYDVSNKRILGLTEIELIKEMEKGVKQLMQMERDK